MNNLQSILDFSQRTDDGLIVTEADLEVLFNDAFRAGAEAARAADCLAMCPNCEDGVPLEELPIGWIHRRPAPSGYTSFCRANAIRNLPIPEMDKPQ